MESDIVSRIEGASSTSSSTVSAKSTPATSLDNLNKLEVQNGQNGASPSPIPPPAEFDDPTRPSTLLAALVRGPISLDESSLSPTTQKHLAYLQRYSQSAFFPHSGSQSKAAAAVEEKENAFPHTDFLPTSPLSPPSPFQHPYFRRQLSLLPFEPWSRFTGFGLPRLNPLFHEPVSKTPQLDNEEPPQPKMPKKSKKNKYRLSATNNILCFNQETNSYKVCRETRFYSTYSDGVSETESEDEEPTPSASISESKILLQQLARNRQNGDATSANSFSSSGDEVMPLSSTSSASSSATSSSHNTSSSIHPPLCRAPFFKTAQDDDTSSPGLHNRGSQIASLEADAEDANSLLSEPDSIHEVASSRSSSCWTAEDDHTSSLPPSPPKQVSLDNHENESKRSPSSIDTQENANNYNGNCLDTPSKRDRLQKIALELLNTEKTYVDVLHLIDQEFQFRVDQQNRVHHFFPSDQVPIMFSNIKSIYKLHHDFLLPQLEERMTNFESCRRIGDIMKNFAPFLKMYTEYVRNFDTAMNNISTWQAKSSKFAAIMDEIHQLESCGHLTLQHHMLSPVQRIPRYEMLLKDYLRRLPLEDPDREDTEEALRLVSTAANHANDAMKKIEKFKKLLEVQESLGGAVELVSPTRELLKEGKIIKISARSGDHQERYLFLLSDLLLLCSPRLIGGRVISTSHYRLRAKYKVENLEVLEGDNLETANSFYIRDSDKTVELYTHTKEEKGSWLSSLFDAIEAAMHRKSSLMLSSNRGSSFPLSVPDSDLGLKHPIFIRTESVSKCMACCSHFSVVRRKHHCRACGAVLCHKCSSYKAALTCESGKNVRVCKSCYDILSSINAAATPNNANVSTDVDADGGESGESLQSGASSRPESIDDSKFESPIWKSKGVLEISADATGAIAKGFLQLKTHRKAWVRRWFCLHRDFVLYSFKSEDSTEALTATPVPGFAVVKLQSKGESGLGEKEREKAFKLFHSKKQYVFLSTTKEDAARWLLALQKASKAELSSPFD